MSARRLQQELGTTPPTSVAALPDADLARLADALGRARTEHARAMTEALERGLGFLPRPLRGPVSKALLR